MAFLNSILFDQLAGQFVMHPVEGSRHALTAGEDPAQKEAKQQRTWSNVISHEVNCVGELQKSPNPIREQVNH